MNASHASESQARAVLRIAAMAAWILLMFLPVLLLWAVGWQRARARGAQLFYAVILRLIGLRVSAEGVPSAVRPLMVVANHTSYLDIFVIGAQLPVSFTSKREIRSWPVIGFFAVLADCVFVERRPTYMEQARAEMAQRIGEGRALCLFPEGTTSNGKILKPFKSGFFSLADDHALPVQPVSLSYTHIGRHPITDATREQVAWVGEATFFDHFWRVLALPGIRVTVRWHAPLQRSDYADRKALSKAAETLVTAGVMADMAPGV